MSPPDKRTIPPPLQLLTDLEKELKAIGKGSVSAGNRDKWMGIIASIKTTIKSSLTQHTADTSASESNSQLIDLANTPPENHAKTCLEEIKDREVQTVTINRVHLLGICKQAIDHSSNPPTTNDSLSGAPQMVRIETMLQAIKQDNEKIKHDILQLKSHPLNTGNSSGGSAAPGQTYASATKSTIKSNSKQRPAGSSLVRESRTDKRATVTATPKIQLTSIRIRARDKNNNIDTLFAEHSAPEGLYVRSRTLYDGSKVIYTSKETELRTFLTSIETIEIVERISFKPRIKVMYVPVGTEAEDVEAKLGASSRLLRTIKLSKGQHNHLIYEVDPNQYKHLIGSRIYLPGFNACQIIQYKEAPTCAHCIKPGHTADHCHKPDDEPVCARCSKNGHKAESCEAQLCCINCLRAGFEETKHSAFDQRRCPELLRYAEWRNRNTDYGQ